MAQSKCLQQPVLNDIKQRVTAADIAESQGLRLERAAPAKSTKGLIGGRP